MYFTNRYVTDSYSTLALCYFDTPTQHTITSTHYDSAESEPIWMKFGTL